MSSVAEASIDTAELTRGQRGILATLASADYVDQLSRFERRLTAETWRAKLIERERQYVSRGRILTVKWRDYGQPLPAWFDPVMQGFADLITLEPKWDSYRGKQIERVVIEKAMDLLDTVLTPTSSVPSIVPLSSGGLQIEWHGTGQDLEIIFEPRQSPEFFYKNTRTGSESEGSVASQLGFLIQLIRALE